MKPPSPHTHSEEGVGTLGVGWAKGELGEAKKSSKKLFWADLLLNVTFYVTATLRIWPQTVPEYPTVLTTVRDGFLSHTSTVTRPTKSESLGDSVTVPLQAARLSDSSGEADSQSHQPGSIPTVCSKSS